MPLAWPGGALICITRKPRNLSLEGKLTWFGPSSKLIFMIGIIVALFVAVFAVCAILYSLDAGLRERTPRDAQMSKRISARWAAIIRAGLQRVS